MKEIISIFKNQNVLVIGDVMLDEYIHGYVERVSPEAPVPVVRHSKQEKLAGGAANVAMNCLALGAEVSLIGIIGSDYSGNQLTEVIVEKGIHFHPVQDTSRPTIVKQRIVSGGHQLLRVDVEETHAITLPSEQEIKQQVVQITTAAKASGNPITVLFLSDYAKGLFTQSLTSWVIEYAHKENIPVLADTKPANKHFFRGVDVLKPNLKEAKIMTGKDIVADMARHLVEELHTNVIITEGNKGMTVMSKEGKLQKVAGKSVAVFDVTGAGDTVLATLGIAIASGGSLEDAAELANTAGALVVQKKGTATVSCEELEHSFRNEISALIKESIAVKSEVVNTQLEKIEMLAKKFVETYKNSKKVIVFGNGGSTSDAQHLVAELVGRFKMERRSLRALSLNAEAATMTAIANDYGYDRIFERQLSAHAEAGDVVIGISTSGNSPNVLLAMEHAKELGCYTVGLTGKDGGKLPSYCDLCIVVPSDNTPRIQEVHILIIHIVCELMEKEFFASQNTVQKASQGASQVTSLKQDL